MAQALSRRPLTAEARVRSRVIPCGICGGQSGIGTGLSPRSSVLPYQFNSIDVSLHRKTKKTNHLHHRVAQQASRLRCVRSICCGTLQHTKKNITAYMHVFTLFLCFSVLSSRLTATTSVLEYPSHRANLHVFIRPWYKFLQSFFPQAREIPERAAYTIILVLYSTAGSWLLFPRGQSNRSVTLMIKPFNDVHSDVSYSQQRSNIRSHYYNSSKFSKTSIRKFQPLERSSEILCD